MKHPHAVSLAQRLLDSHIRLHAQQPERPTPNPEQLRWAVEILSTHLDACMRQRIHPDLTEAVSEALDFAQRHEKAYEPIPGGLRWRSALVMMDAQDAD
ncbi:MAG: hypothetical protein HYR56_01350 [Acidobacteria bacterium]|nr:hypothetical protein [Acidobacteriota bacterium]MBI3423896.1 hypothetical protein [Acidobacteriota bacterium]